MKLALAAACLVASAAVARADAIALLPLDADARFEVYSQPVAAEIAKGLAGPDLEVVVVGPKAAVPDRAQLVVFGTIASSGAEVVLTLHVRTPAGTKELGKPVEARSTLENLDRAAADLSRQLVVEVKKQLLALKHGPVTEGIRPPQPVTLQAMLVGIAAHGVAASALRTGFADRVPAWLRAHRREARDVDPTALLPKVAGQTVRAGNADRAMLFEVLDFDASVDKKTKAQFATARVRLRIADGGGVLFDRVIATDTVVAKADLPREQLVAMVVDEVLAIAKPHVTKVVPSW